MSTNNSANQLIAEKSPYLLQHAHNPVNWYPWGDEAFNKAKNENKPIFLSIGYSTCHWCHVMAEESFEDEEVAAVLNEKYVAIKVDREERPDVDSIYMKVCQMMTGHGGWPLSIFMTPEQVPFYAGTYFPKNSMHGLPGFVDVLTGLAEKYKQDPKHISEVTKNVTDALQKLQVKKSKNRLGKKHLDEAYKQLAKQFDFLYGGFGDEPKFPMPQNILFLLYYYHYSKNKDALKMAEATLQHMARGGIFDHVGFGFARYATDSEWLVPHFEKMLYDNALLLIAYTACYQVTGDAFYKDVSEKIITFIQREMTSEEGAFYSAIDADSEGEEGNYYTFTYDEVLECLGDELGHKYATTYDITMEGNFERKNIPNLIEVDHITTLQTELEEARLKLLAYREQRVYPHVDDKILTSWNGMMIAALAKAGKVYEKPEYVTLAENAIGFIEKKLVKNDRLMARYRDGETKFKAYLDDYAFLLWGYIELYEATFSPRYLEKASHLATQMVELFLDETDGGFYFTGKDSEQLITKDKEIQDGAIPSGNSTAANMLLRLGSLTGKRRFIEYTDKMYYTFYEDIHRYPQLSPFFLCSLLVIEHHSREVVVLKERNDSELNEFLSKFKQTFLPDTTLLVTEQPEQLAKAAPFAANYKKIKKQTTVYICENFSCQQPTTNLKQATSELFGK